MQVMLVVDFGVGLGEGLGEGGEGLGEGEGLGVFLEQSLGRLQYKPLDTILEFEKSCEKNSL